jgi:asparagine synthase (glutamine-hydrolysing)
MCGIVGKVRADGGPVGAALVESMCAALEHRGPDSRGVHLSAGAGLGIQRLRVIDLATGDQPIYNEDRTVAVVLNGEIYNYRELRQRLERAGHRFQTQGDTEVIAHLYEEEGAACVRSLHGMFAFAVWDSRRRQLLLARDRVGKKPLFYCEREGTLAFASELNALLEDPDVPRELDHEALDHYLAYLYVPAPHSVFRSVRKLPPATTLVWRDGRAAFERYWGLDYSAKREWNDLEELHEEIRDGIRRAVRKRLLADVPLGAFLSGGIDSSAVVAAMAQESDERIKTFSIGFEQDGFDELPYARQTAELFDTEHHEFVVRPDAIELLPRIVRHYGEPFADSSAIPSFYLAELTRRHVTVALNGDGGDETFAGYYYYVANSVGARLDRLPLWLRRGAQAVGERLPTNGNVRSTLNRARRLTGSLALHPGERFSRYVACFSPAQRAALYTDEFAAGLPATRPEQIIVDTWDSASGQAPLDKMLEVDATTYLPGDLLVKMDIATMAYSLEARSPLLDHELMELAASIPAELKLRGRQKKAVLRDALRPWLPAEILDRPKQGFQVPIAAWLRGELRGYARDVLLDPGALDRGYHRGDVVERMLDDHAAGRADESPRIWALLVQELWHREYVDRPLSRPLSPAARAA